MKLSDYAKKAGVSYQTAGQWWQKGHLTGYQLPSGTIIITEEEEKKTDKIACIYARVSSAENKDNLERQAERLKDYAIARGYQIYKVVKEIGSGLNDNRPKLAKILTDSHYNILIVEHKDRLARFGTNYLELLLKEMGKTVEIVNHSENKQDELMEDLIAIITSTERLDMARQPRHPSLSFCSRLYGLRRSKRKTEKIIAELKERS